MFIIPRSFNLFSSELDDVSGFLHSAENMVAMMNLNWSDLALVVPIFILSRFHFTMPFVKSR